MPSQPQSLPVASGGGPANQAAMFDIGLGRDDDFINVIALVGLHHTGSSGPPASSSPGSVGGPDRGAAPREGEPPGGIYRRRCQPPTPVTDCRHVAARTSGALGGERASDN